MRAGAVVPLVTNAASGPRRPPALVSRGGRSDGPYADSLPLSDHFQGGGGGGGGGGLGLGGGEGGCQEGGGEAS